MIYLLLFDLIAINHGFEKKILGEIDCFFFNLILKKWLLFAKNMLYILKLNFPKFFLQKNYRKTSTKTISG
jgi:hypothetical protein